MSLLMIPKAFLPVYKSDPVFSAVFSCGPTRGSTRGPRRPKKFNAYATCDIVGTILSPPQKPVEVFIRKNITSDAWLGIKDSHIVFNRPLKNEAYSAPIKKTNVL